MSNSRIRVLIVDDSVVVRKLITDIVSSAADLEVVGTASDGRVALSKIPMLKPDVVTLDVEMEGMDGLETLDEIKRLWPMLPVVMCSSLTERGAATTLDALAGGARDYITKPTVGSAGERPEPFPDELLRKLRIHGRAGVQRSAAKRTAAPISPLLPKRPQQAVDLVVVGSSTGGPNALSVLVAGLPESLKTPVLIVQHMPPVFTRLLAERLDRVCQLKVSEAVDGELLVAGHVYLAPGGYHLMLGGSKYAPRAVLNTGSPENSCRPAVDVLFWSAAEMFGSSVLAVVLTGMGQDGLRGVEHLREGGAQVIVQDEATSVVWGMPGTVAEHGLADEIVPLNEIASKIVRRVGVGAEGRVAATVARSKGGPL